jgi:deoxyribodipyrimidine photo-lyase
MRQVHQATEARIAALQAAPTPTAALAYALRGFTGRLRWHCHFMQKLEDEPAIEFRNFARVCDGLREGDFDRRALRCLRPGARAAPASRWSTPACAACAPPAG